MTVAIQQIEVSKHHIDEIVESECDKCGYDRMIHTYLKHADVHMLKCNNPNCETTYEP